MSTSSIRVDQGTGPYIWTDQRTVSSVAREAQYVLLAEPALPTFSVVAVNAAIATTGDHTLQLMAGASNYIRLQRIYIHQATAGTAATAKWTLTRLTSAGSGGSSITPSPYDLSDTATATCMTSPSSKGTEGVAVSIISLPTTAAAPPAAEAYVWEAHPRCKPIIIPAGTSNGLALRLVAGVATVTVAIEIVFTETAWL